MRLDIEFFVFLQERGLNARSNLIGYVFYMSTTFARANRIDKAYLLKLAVTQAADYFPTIASLLYNLRESFVLNSGKIKVRIVNKSFDRYRLSVELNFDFAFGNTSDIINSFGKKRNDVFV